MREIKFRGKVMWNGNHKYSGDWIYGYYRYNEVGNAFITETIDDFDDYIFDETEVDKNTVGQYTGIKDVSGNEIYEGDILKDAYAIYKIIFKNGGFYAKVEKVIRDVGTQKELEYAMSLIEEWNDTEVIGNIYENPELLEKE